MKLLTCFFNTFLIVIILASCSSSKIVINDSDKTQAVNAQAISTDINNSDEEKFELIDEQITDIDNDGNNDIIRLYINNDEAARILYVKLSINDEMKKYEIKSPRGFDCAKKMIFTKLNNGYKGILIKFFNKDHEDSFLHEHALPYAYDFNCIVAGYYNDKVETLLNLFEHTFNKENNYTIKYLGDFQIQFCDLETNFSAIYKAHASDVNKPEYEKRFEQLNNFRIPEKMSQICFYEIKAKDINADGIDEIICSKYIPGVYYNDVLGVIDYEFKLNKEKYNLAKISLWYNKMVDLPLIKEQVINNEN